MPRPKQRTPALRRRVVDVAVAALAESGIAALRAREIARRAATSVPAVYELFGDKRGLLREVVLEGFRKLRRHLERGRPLADPRRELERTVVAFRAFARRHPVLAGVMFARAVADLEVAPGDREAAAAVREVIVGRVARCVDAGLLAGDPIDIAHAVLALAQGLAAQERAGWLGRGAAARDRRWALGVRALLEGLRPAGAAQRSRKKRAPIRS